MTIGELSKDTSLNLNNQISHFEREILLSLALGKSREYILAHPEIKLTRPQTRKYFSYAARRSSGEPIAYIAGEKEFYGLDFLVNKNILVPRPETELLTELVIKKIRNTKYEIPYTIIDVGTGSGNIIISILKNLPGKIQNKINFCAVDISKDALSVARKNARKHKADKKINFIQSDLLEYFFKKKNKNYKNIFVVANLPYVSPALYQKNKTNLKFEPKSALISKKEGLDHYTRLIREIREIKEKICGLHFVCYMEISPEQKPKIGRIIGEYLPSSRMHFFKDLSGRWRIAEVENVFHKFE